MTGGNAASISIEIILLFFHCAVLSFFSFPFFSPFSSYSWTFFLSNRYTSESSGLTFASQMKHPHTHSFISRQINAVGLEVVA